MSAGFTAQVVELLNADGWCPRWPGCDASLGDEYGNVVHLAAISDGETMRVEFEYALPGLVETLHLDPLHGAERVAAVIAALASPQLWTRVDFIRPRHECVAHSANHCSECRSCSCHERKC